MPRRRGRVTFCRAERGRRFRARAWPGRAAALAERAARLSAAPRTRTGCGDAALTAPLQVLTLATASVVGPLSLVGVSRHVFPSFDAAAQFTDEPLARFLCAWFVCFLVLDCAFGSRHYPKQFSLFEGWFHHAAYIAFFCWGLSRGYSVGFASTSGGPRGSSNPAFRPAATRLLGISARHPAASPRLPRRDCRAAAATRARRDPQVSARAADGAAGAGPLLPGASRGPRVPAAAPKSPVLETS